MKKTELASTIAKAYFPPTEQPDSLRAQSFISRMTRRNKADLEDLAITAEKVLAQRK